MSEPAWVALGAAQVDYEGPWAAGTAYVPGDVVTYGGMTYLAVNPSTGQTPPGVVGPGLPAVAIVREQKAVGTHGGNAVLGWQTRTLSTMVSDPAGIIRTLASNRVTLDPGTYLLEADVPWFSGSGARTRARLVNITSGETIALSSVDFGSTGNVGGTNHPRAVVVLAAATQIEVQQWFNAAASEGLGLATLNPDTELGVFTVLTVMRLK